MSGLIEDLSFVDGAAVVARNCQLNLTTRCPRRCVFCPVKRGGRDRSGGSVAARLEAYARRHAEHLAATELILTGGEPALWPALLGTARLGRDLGFRSVTLQSSAEAFAEPGFAAGAAASGIRRLLLSLHSHRPGIHDFLTGTRGRFERAVAGVVASLDLGFSHVTCNMVLGRLNHKDVPAHAAFLARLRARAGGRTPLALFLSTMEENPRWMSLRVSHSEAASFVARACREGAVEVLRFMGDWTMPVCIGALTEAAPGLAPLGRRDVPAWYAPEGWNPSVHTAPPAFLRVKARACRGCALDGVCAGLSRVYALAYGVRELDPVRRRPRAAGRGKDIFIV